MSSYILAARSAVVPGAPALPGLSGPPPALPVGAPRMDRQNIRLLGVNGDVIQLTGGREGLHVAQDPAPYGFWFGGYDSVTERTPGVDGARYGDITATARGVGLAVHFDRENVEDRRVLADRLVRALNPKRGVAGFLVTEPDATSRLITGRFVGSSERVFTTRQHGTWGIDLLAADDPFWQDAPGSELPAQTWSAPEPVDFYPYLPTNLTEDSAIGEPVVIDNDGHEDIYPTWLIYGPATSALLTGAGDLDRLLWEGNLPAGKWLTIITQPGLQQVVDSDGVSRFHELAQDPEPSFWPLEPGNNTISTVIGGIGVGTRVTLMDLTRRWLIQG